MNGYTYYVCDIATKFNYYDRQKQFIRVPVYVPHSKLPLSYISTNSIPVNRRRCQSSRP